MEDHGISSFRVKARRSSLWIFALLVVPLLSELLESGRLPNDLRGIVSLVILTFLVGALCAWVVRRERSLVEASRTDALTGLKNRRCFIEDLEREIWRSRRLGTTLVVAYVDVNELKRINDTLGHVQGDQCLRDVGELLRSTFRRAVEECYRIGGDEFAVLTSSPDSEDEPAERHVEERLQRVSTQLEATEPYRTGLAVGVTTLVDGDLSTDVLKRADASMYELKRHRRSRGFDVRSSSNTQKAS